MGKYISKILTLLSVLMASSVGALPMGNPLEATLLCEGWLVCPSPCSDWTSAFSYRLGYSSDYVFNRKMEVQRVGSPQVDETTIQTNAAFFALNWSDRIDLFATLGASRIEMNTQASAFRIAPSNPQDENNDFHIRTETDVSWGVGVRASLLCLCGWNLGAEWGYFYTNPDISYVKQENKDVLYLDDKGAKYTEWQVGVGIARFISYSCSSLELIPYVGVKVSQADMKMNSEVVTIPIFDNVFELFDVENKLVVGIPFGVTLTLCNTIGVTVEGRFGDEQALYVNGQFRF